MAGNENGRISEMADVGDVRGVIPPPEEAGGTAVDLGSTAALIARARAGDRSAREELAARHLALLRRWAAGRLPGHARGLAETVDLVQVAVMRALDKLDTFEARREGAFLAYLRQIFMNLVRNEIRRSETSRRGHLPDDLPVEDVPPLERMIDRKVLDSYEAALETLPAVMREAVIMKLEFGFTNREIAEAIGRSSPDAARMMLSRALARLTKQMERRQ
jgi:RNA polymerase sigma-70 factor (ECF subfamily)